MTLNEQIAKDMTAAMKEQDKFTLSVLRMLKSAIQMEKISKMHDLNDDETISVIKKQVKMRKDSIEEYQKFKKPIWFLLEVTNDSRFSNSNLIEFNSYKDILN